MIIAGALIFEMAALRFVDISEEEVKRMKKNAITKGTKDTSLGVTLFEGRT